MRASFQASLLLRPRYFSYSFCNRHHSKAESLFFPPDANPFFSDSSSPPPLFSFLLWLLAIRVTANGSGWIRKSDDTVSCPVLRYTFLSVLRLGDLASNSLSRAWASGLFSPFFLPNRYALVRISARRSFTLLLFRLPMCCPHR